MIGFQKIIKYLAIAFAIFLLFNILSIFTNIFSSFDIFLGKSTSEKIIEKLNIKGEVNSLDIDVSSVNLTFKESDSFKVKSNSEYVYGKQEGKQLIIKEKKHSIFKGRDKRDLTIYIPRDYVFRDIDIKNGAGKMNIKYLATNILDMNLGAGSIDIDYLNVTDAASIESGVGSFKIYNGSIHNLDLEVGVGKATITSRITGKSKVESGVGVLELNLIGKESDYKTYLKKGIGSISINGDSINDSEFGTGENIIHIEGGVGSTKINFVDETDR